MRFIADPSTNRFVTAGYQRALLKYVCRGKTSSSWDKGAPLSVSLLIAIKRGINEVEKSQAQFTQVAFAEQSNSKWQLPGGYLREVKRSIVLRG